MSNLSELLPSGGGQNQVEFVASGTLPNGKPVVLKSNGQVEVVGETSVSDGTTAYGNFATYSDGDNSTVYHEAEGCIVSCWKDQSNGFTYAKAGVVSANSNSISWGSTVQSTVSGNANNFAPTSMIYDPSSKKVMIFKNNVAFGLSVSGTTVTWDNNYGYDYDDTGTPKTAIGLDYDPTHEVIVITFANQHGRISVRTLDTSTMTFGTRVQPNGTVTSGNFVAKIVYDKNTGKHICIFDGGNYNTRPKYSIISITGSSGSNVTFTSPASLSLPNYSGYVAYAGLNIVQDPVSNFIMVMWAGSNDYGNVRGYLFSTTGITSTTNTTVFASYASQNFNVISFPPSGAIFGMWKLDADPQSTRGASFSGMAANSTIAYTTVFNVGNGQKERNHVQNNNIGAYASNANKIVIGLHNYESGNSQIRPANIYIVQPQYSHTNLTSTSLIGISAEAASSGATAKINTWGGINESQTSLTIGTDYYAQTNGTITTASVSPAQKLGTAISATTINIRDLP